MRLARFIALMLAIGMAGLIATRLLGADQAAERPFGGPVSGRSSEERPFGGPPPSRNPKKVGKKCQTAARVCELGKQMTVGSECSCPGDDKSIGKVAQ